MLLSASPSSLHVTNLVTKVEAATVSVPYVKPEVIQEQWAVGDYVDSVGNVVKDAVKNVGFQTSKAESGTLVLEIRRNQYCEPCWEKIRTSTNGTPRILLYAEPYQLDGRDDYAEKVTDTVNTAIDYMNRDSKEDYYLRVSFYIKKPDSDHTYWLGMAGSNDPKSYYFKAYFYPGVNLVPLSKAERDQYFKGQSINGGSSNNSGSNNNSSSSNNSNKTNTNNSNKTNTNSSNKKYIGRLVIKSNNVVLYNSKGKVYRKLRKNEDVHVYAIKGNRYLVGGGYYVLKNKDTAFYLGTIYSKKGDMIIYNSKGKPYKKLKAKQTVKVYAVKNNRYEVGGGYYVLSGSNIVFQR